MHGLYKRPNDIDLSFIVVVFNFLNYVYSTETKYTEFMISERKKFWNRDV